MEQLSFPDLYFTPLEEIALTVHDEVRGSGENACIAWLVKTNGCPDAVAPLARRLFAEFERVEAWNRAHALVNLSHAPAEDGWSLRDAERIGLFDHSIADYHVIWDRGWAINMLVPRELVPKVFRCDYGARPRFFDHEGNVLFRSIYTVDGHPLSREERRQALARERDEDE